MNPNSFLWVRGLRSSLLRSPSFGVGPKSDVSPRVEGFPVTRAGGDPRSGGSGGPEDGPAPGPGESPCTGPLPARGGPGRPPDEAGPQCVRRSWRLVALSPGSVGATYVWAPVLQKRGGKKGGPRRVRVPEDVGRSGLRPPRTAAAAAASARVPRPKAGARVRAGPGRGAPPVLDPEGGRGVGSARSGRAENGGRAPRPGPGCASLGPQRPPASSRLPLACRGRPSPPTPASPGPASFA